MLKESAFIGSKDYNIFCNAFITAVNVSKAAQPLLAKLLHMSLQYITICAPVRWITTATNVSYLYQCLGKLSVIGSYLHIKFKQSE